MIGIGLGAAIGNVISGGSTFNPDTLTGLVARWRGDGLAVGGATWTDRSSNNYTLIAGTNGAAFTKVTGINGRAAASTDGTKWREVTFSSGLNAGTVWMIFKPDTIDTYRGIVGFGLYTPSWGFKGANPGVYTGAGDLYFTDLTITNNIGHLLEIKRFGGTSWSCYLDRTASGQNPKTSAYSIGSTNVTVGSDADFGGDPFSGEIYEIIIIDHSASGTEETNVASYVSSYYGL